ncbi:MAG TPA: type II secretion system protein [Patescibacteria group bacterium]|nr:type II secretion system protein [Patescibacteria group bacterium]
MTGNNFPTKTTSGFSLIELLVAIGILAVLLGITLIAINPAQQFAKTNNSKRENDVVSILDGINQYMSDTHGVLPGGLSSAACPSSTPCELQGAAATGAVDLCPTLVTKYLAFFPRDPLVSNGDAIKTCDNTYDSGYKVSVDNADNRITVTAPHAELSAVIKVTR